MYFENLCKELSALKEIEGIALGGSRAGESFDQNSDYDLYLYVSSVPSEAIRKSILQKYCSYMEIGNSYWELEDDCTLKNGIDIDILYRDIKTFEQGIEDVVVHANSHNGYTTCMWHNLLNCKILLDKTGEPTQLKEKYNIPYPAQLKKNIIDRNMKLLHGFLPSYEGQINKALKRGDKVAVNHRIAAFMESYFDVIFALNEMTHPGEKREVLFAKKGAKKLPVNFEENIDSLFSSIFDDSKKENVPKLLADIVENISCIICSVNV